MPRHIRRGFTLIELMIVVAIMAILLALLVPGLRGVWELADDWRCTTNLYFLSHAIAMHRSDASTNWTSELRVLRWPNLLSPYLEEGEGVFMCPLPSVVESPPVVQDAADDAPPLVWAGSDAGGRANSPAKDPNNYSTCPPLTELAALRIGSKVILELDAGPYVLKLSDEQFQGANAQGWFGADNSLRHPRETFDCNYRPGANPYLYYLCAEDSLTTSGQNQDFNDVVIRVLDKRDGSYELTITCATAGSHAIVSKPDNQTLLPLSPGGYGGRALVTQQATVGLAEADPSPTASANPAFQGLYFTPDLTPVSTVILLSNYAMNADNRYFNYSPGKVALLDYYKYVFHAADDWTTSALDPNRDGISTFARHRGRINVLFTDGSVQFMEPAELDPVNPTAYVRYWAP